MILTRPQFLALAGLTVGQFDMLKQRGQFFPYDEKPREKNVYFLIEVLMTLVAEQLSMNCGLDRGATRKIVGLRPGLFTDNVDEADRAEIALWYGVKSTSKGQPSVVEIATWDRLPEALSRPFDEGVARITAVNFTEILALVRVRAEVLGIEIENWLEI